MHPRHFKKSKCMTIYVVVFCLWEGGWLYLVVFSVCLFSQEPGLFQLVLQGLHPLLVWQASVLQDFTHSATEKYAKWRHHNRLHCPLRPIQLPLQQWGHPDVGENTKSVLTHSHLSKGVNDLKQKGTQYMSSYSGQVFYTLSQGVIHFVGTVSFCYQHNHKIFVVGFHWTFIGCLKFLTIQKSALTS